MTRPSTPACPPPTADHDVIVAVEVHILCRIKIVLNAVLSLSIISFLSINWTYFLALCVWTICTPSFFTQILSINHDCVHNIYILYRVSHLKAGISETTVENLFSLLSLRLWLSFVGNPVYLWREREREVWPIPASSSTALSSKH